MRTIENRVPQMSPTRARPRCSDSGSLPASILLVATAGVVIVLWLQPQLGVPDATTASDGRRYAAATRTANLSAADCGSRECPVGPPCASPARPEKAAAAGGEGPPAGPGAADPAFLAGNVERTYYGPLIRQLADLGPPATSCLPSLDAPAPAVFPRKKRKFDMVLVLAQGRSGSTTLMRLLNTIPCYNIRGENLLLFAKLMGASTMENRLTADTFREATLKLRAHYVHPWNATRYGEPKLPKKPSYFNRFDMPRLEGLLRLVVGEVLQHVPGYVTSGFKELRLFNLNACQYNMSVTFLDHWTTLFPRTAIVFGYREKDIMNSAWWKDSDRAWTEKLLKQQLEWFREIHDLVNSRKRFGAGVESVMVEFDDLISCNDGPSSGLKQAYDMLGETFDPAKCRALMENNVEDMGLAASEGNFKDEQVGGRRLLLHPVIDDADGFRRDSRAGSMAIGSWRAASCPTSSCSTSPVRSGTARGRRSSSAQTGTDPRPRRARSAGAPRGLQSPIGGRTSPMPRADSGTRTRNRPPSRSPSRHAACRPGAPRAPRWW
ncbi:hypothetical protein DFJ74DRAFT_392913 [Hyaloraphidium curvatum]|nr:hypothetical protein DFJ74DRAFT_392913 [Hyaloraphidium curvatum]